MHFYRGGSRNAEGGAPRCQRQRREARSAERRVAPISRREARKKKFAIIFQLQGWALVAPSWLAGLPGAVQN